MKIAISVLKELSEQKNISEALWSKHPVDISEIEEILYYAEKINKQLKNFKIYYELSNKLKRASSDQEDKDKFQDDYDFDRGYLPQ